jgi:hypothetical protein
VKLVGPEGVEPSTLGLRGRCAADCATIPFNWYLRMESNHRCAVIGRDSSPLEDAGKWWGKAESNGAPEGNRITAGILRPADDTSPLFKSALAPPRELAAPAEGGTDVPPHSQKWSRRAGSNRDRRDTGALLSPLSYDGVADSLGHDPNTQSGYALLSRQARQPRRLCCPSIWRSAEESNPLPVGYPSQFSGLVADHSAGTLLVGTRGGIRTHTTDGLSVVPPADWATRAWCSERDSNPHLTASRTASSTGLGYPSWCDSWVSNPDWTRFEHVASAG